MVHIFCEKGLLYGRFASAWNLKVQDQAHDDILIVMYFLIMNKTIIYITYKICKRKKLWTFLSYVIFPVNNDVTFFDEIIIKTVNDFSENTQLRHYSPTTKCVWGGGLKWIRFVASVRPSVGPSARLHYRVRSINHIPFKGFSSNLAEMFTSTRRCAEPMLPM